MEAITYKCPNCGGDLTFDPASGKYKCEYCLSSFTQEEAEKANPKAAEALNGADDAAGARDECEAQKESSKEEAKGDADRSYRMNCSRCSKEIWFILKVITCFRGNSHSIWTHQISALYSSVPLK